MIDVKVGDALPPFRVAAVDPARMRTMTVIMRNPNPIHFDVDEVKRLGLGDKLISQGPISMGYILTMLCAFAGTSAAIRGLKVRFHGNVFASDAVQAGGVVTSMEHGAEGTRIGCAVWLDRIGHGRAVEGSAMLMVALST